MKRVDFPGATLYCGDCRDVLDVLRTAAVVVTDPPYGMAFVSGHASWGGSDAPWAGNAIANDHSVECRDEVLAALGLPFASFASLREDAPNGTRGTLVWDKGDAAGMGDLAFPWKPNFELVHVGGDGWTGRRTSSVLRANVVTWAQQGRTHPTEKPVALFREIIAKAPPGTVVDPFMGTGATGVAAARDGRDFIGVEIDPGYFAIACERIDAATRQPDMFVQALATP